MKAYIEGLQGFLFGATLRENPYRKGTKQHQRWQQGWRDRQGKFNKRGK